MTPEQILEIVGRIDFKMFPSWRIWLKDDGPRFYLQVTGTGACNDTGAPIQWSGRKWMLSPHMTTTEIVNTVFKAYQAALDHEFRECFLYRGVRVYDPHTDVEALVRFVADTAPDVRAPHQLQKPEAGK